ncbi:MAG TPA: amidohydrolase family protein [Candidatus Limnocylindria bacterium]|nr:amidohydrolase family protein [Candidatus Limnocylindria bacterium]
MKARPSIDVHDHYAPPAYRAVAKRCADRDPLFASLNDRVAPGDQSDPLVRLDRRLEEMGKSGLDVLVLSINPPSAVPADESLAAELMASANDGLLEACAAAPDRLLMLAALPLPHADAALAELARLEGRAAVSGVCIGVSGISFAPDAAEWRPVLERVAALRLPLMLHPQLIDPSRSDDPFAHAFAEYGLRSGVQAMVATSLAALRLVLSGCLDDLPELVVIVPHLGGVIPYLAQRLADQTMGRNARPLEHYLRERFFYDNCSYHHAALRCAIDTVGADRIMLGSDYPFRGPLGRCLETVLRSDLDERTKSLIAGETASRWFTPRA